MKPMMAGILISPVVKRRIKTPPMRASGRLSRMTADCDALRNWLYNSRNTTSSEKSDTIERVREAAASLSNCPPYSMK